MRVLESCRACTTVSPIPRIWILILVLAALVALTPPRLAVANESEEEDNSPPSLAEPPKEGRPVSFEATEGTWLNLTLSPDGETLVFNLLGDIYSLPAGGGEAKRISSGPSYPTASFTTPRPWTGCGHRRNRWASSTGSAVARISRLCLGPDG